MYEPYNRDNDSNQTKLLTGKEKISELQALLEEKNLENDEMKV